MHVFKSPSPLRSVLPTTKVDGREIQKNAILIDQFFGSKGCLDPNTGWPMSQITLLERSSRIGSTHASEYRDVASRLLTLAGDNNAKNGISVKEMLETCKPKWMQTFSELHQFEEYLVSQGIVKAGDLTGSEKGEDVVESENEEGAE